MPDFFSRLFDSSGFAPGSQELIWLHNGTDVLIGLACSVISCLLIYFVRRRPGTPFSRLFWMFAAFLICCGFIHLLEAVMFHVPLVRLSAALKIMTALAAWATVLALASLLPRALAVRGPAELQREIAERQKAEEKFRRLLEAVPDAMLIVKEDGEIVLLNSQAEKLFGYRREELLGQPADLLVPKRLRDVPAGNRSGYYTRPRLPSAQDGPTLYGLRKDGSEFPVEVSLNPLHTEEGALFSSTIRDVTDRWRAETALRQQTALVRLIQVVAVAANCASSSEDALQACLDGVCAHTGWPIGHVYFPTSDSPHDLVSAPLWHLDDPQRFAAFQQATTALRVAAGTGLPGRVFVQGKPEWVADMGQEPTFARLQEARRVGLKTAIAFPVLVGMEVVAVMEFFSTRSLKVDEPLLAVMAHLGTQLGRSIERQRATDTQARQMRELTQAQEALQQSNRELQEFASVASHDLQEPLRKIQAFGDRLRAKCAAALDEPGRDYLDRMQSAASRMRSLIDDLLVFARVTSKAQPFLPVNLAQVAQEVVADLEERIHQTGGRVEVGDLPTIEADPMQMRQLLQNLISNGLKFHRQQEPPLIRVHAQGVPEIASGGNGTAVAAPCCQLIVEDNGIGFDEKYLDRLFHLFQRLHGRGEYEGTGMGLAICRRIAERHGGTIAARGVPGCGATFVVSLPVEHGNSEGRL